MYPQITINISISPDGIKILEDVPEAESEAFGIPAIPGEGMEGLEAGIDEIDFAPPVPEEEYEEAAEQLPVPPEPEE